MDLNILYYLWFIAISFCFLFSFAVLMGYLDFLDTHLMFLHVQSLPSRYYLGNFTKYTQTKTHTHTPYIYIYVYKRNFFKKKIDYEVISYMYLIKKNNDSLNTRDSCYYRVREIFMHATLRFDGKFIIITWTYKFLGLNS